MRTSDLDSLLRLGVCGAGSGYRRALFSPMLMCPSLASTATPLEESLLQPLLNARVISSANSQAKAAWHVLSLIREDRGYASKDRRDFN